MGKWDEYQDFSTTAASHGGANAYLDFLNNNAKEEGKEEGRIEGGIIGAVVTLVATGIVCGGVWTFGKVKEYVKKRKQKKQLAADIRQEFLDNVEQYEKHEDDESPEN